MGRKIISFVNNYSAVLSAIVITFTVISAVWIALGGYVDNKITSCSSKIQQSIETKKLEISTLETEIENISLLEKKHKKA